MKNKQLRLILCLFMCCALLVSFVKPAYALDPVTIGYSAVAVTVAVACALQALGYMSASNSQTFTDTVNSASQYMSANSAWVDDGLVLAAGFIGAQNGFLPVGFVQQLWQWLFDTEAVYVSGYRQASTLTSLGSLSYSSALSYASQCQHCFSYILPNTDNVREIVAFSGGNYTYDPTSKDLLIYASSTSIYFWNDDTGKFQKYSRSYNWAASNATLVNNAGQVATTQDVSLGQIQSPYLNVGTDQEIIEIQFGVVYEDWAQKVQEFPDPNNPDGDDPDNDGKFPMWLPTGIPSPGYDDSVITQNQQQAQSGVVSGDISFGPYEPGSGGGGGAGSGTDLSSVIQAIVNVPTAIVSSIGDFISDFFGFNGDYDDYTVQLRDFFPFCIPFDLYDFITVLSAEPEAPVFHWEIPVPQLGQTFELEVDLSAWDDIAVLFRNLELLAFIFGLAIMTREKFLRS